jgi:hypothetical protein
MPIDSYINYVGGQKGHDASIISSNWISRRDIQSYSYLGHDIHIMILISVLGADYIIILYPQVHAGAGIPYNYNGVGIRRKDQDLREL